jgi:alkylation response protein AidB-like acyl-CoA dehydrogenase
MTVPSVEMLLIAGRAVFLVFSFALAAVAFTRWRRATQAQTGQVLANHQVLLQRLADLEARVVASHVSIPAPPPAAAPSPGYQIAIRLAKGGASPDELISGCALSTHEAELIHRLHSPQARSSVRRPAAELRQFSNR